MDDAGLDALDSRLVAELRERFPLVPRPFEEVGRRLGIGEEEALERTRALIGRGVIRRIGYMPGERLRRGRATTLVGMKVPPARVQAAADLINGHRGVSHNYLREHEFNLWFTLSAPDRDALDKELTEIADAVRPDDLISLPATRMFKLRSPSGPADDLREAGR